VAFAVILFQLSVIYRRINFVGELTVALIFVVILLQLSRIFKYLKISYLNINQIFITNLNIYMFIQIQ